MNIHIYAYCIRCATERSLVFKFALFYLSISIVGYDREPLGAPIHGNYSREPIRTHRNNESPGMTCITIYIHSRATGIRDPGKGTIGLGPKPFAFNVLLFSDDLTGLSRFSLIQNVTTFGSNSNNFLVVVVALLLHRMQNHALLDSYLPVQFLSFTGFLGWISFVSDFVIVASKEQRMANSLQPIHYCE